jgi:hypothetical protein
MKATWRPEGLQADIKCLSGCLTELNTLAVGTGHVRDHLRVTRYPEGPSRHEVSGCLTESNT